MKKIFIIAVGALLAMSSCSLDMVPSGQMTSDKLKDNPTSALYMTLGNYSMFKDRLPYKGETSAQEGNTYVRHYFQMTEYRGDNMTLCGRTTDHLFQAMTYSDSPGLNNNSYMWWIAYKIIYGANSVIESLAEGQSNEYDHIKGENYFMRAICHLHLVTLYAKPYSLGTDNPGIIIRNSTDTSNNTRATVGAVYTQIVDDLTEAIRLMGKSSAPRGGNKGYASKEAAQGLLSRVYLYMGRNADVITLVDEMLGGADPSTKLDTNVENYFANAVNSSETLWAVAHTADENRAQSSIGSMYYTDYTGGAGVGWGEIYYSDPLLDLYERYPEDKRYTSYCKVNRAPGSAEDAKEIRWEIPNADTHQNELRDASLDGSGYYFMEEGVRVDLVPEVNPDNGYTEYYITIGGVKHRARIAPKATNKFNFPQFFMLKFSNQDGIGMLSSPVMIRWAEVILNRAEALAKTPGREADALADVNVLRTRAGLPSTAMFDMSNYSGRGYASVLDVVLDERRLELCFEGHRAIDQFRNNKALDRRYAGSQVYEVIQPTDNRFPFRIPFDETSVSGIPQND